MPEPSRRQGHRPSATTDRAISDAAIASNLVVDTWRRREDCRLCHGTEFRLVVGLTPTPPANALVDPLHSEREDTVFPLNVYLCEDCGHAQLLDILSPSMLFGDYRYFTGASLSLVSYADTYAADVLAVTGVARGATVLEIGSNDGTQLSAFAGRGLRVVGVDPATRAAEAAAARGVPTINAFFGMQVLDQLGDHAPVDLVVANNVMAHMDDLDDVVTAVGQILAPHGWFVLEVGYLGDVLTDGLFDVIYHEHVDYHALGPLVPFFARHNMTVIHVEQSRMQGGSIRVYVRPTAATNGLGSPAVVDLIRREDALGVTRPETFERFTARVDNLRREVEATVRPLADSGARIWGYGAAAKATTLLYHFGIGDLVETIVDDSPVKQGLLTPGHRIPIAAPRALLEGRPARVVVFAWNYIEHIIRANAQYLDGGGRFIVPLPTLTVVGGGQRPGSAVLPSP